MIIVLSTLDFAASSSNETLSVDQAALDVCPQAAEESDFLRVMEGWL